MIIIRTGQVWVCVHGAHAGRIIEIRGHVVSESLSYINRGTRRRASGSIDITTLRRNYRLVFCEHQPDGADGCPFCVCPFHGVGPGCTCVVGKDPK